MKFVIAMMLAGAVLAFAGAGEALAQEAPVANDHTAKTSKGSYVMNEDGSSQKTMKLILNLTGLGIIEDSDGDLNNAQVEIVALGGNAAGFEHSIGPAPWFVLTASYDKEHAGNQELITYQITDEDGLTDTGTITVNVHSHAGSRGCSSSSSA